MAGAEEPPGYIRNAGVPGMVRYGYGHHNVEKKPLNGVLCHGFAEEDISGLRNHRLCELFLTPLVHQDDACNNSRALRLTCLRMKVISTVDVL